MIKTFRWIIGGINAMIFLPPILYNAGMEKVSRIMYTMMAPLCHQRADRSFYLFGEALNYSKEHVLSQVPFDQAFTINFSNRFVCNDSLGCKFGVCARCTGTYMGLFGGVLASNWVKKLQIPKIIPILLLLPLILDGGIQTLAYILNPERGFYESNNIRRFITGLLFGLSLGYFTVLTVDDGIAKHKET